MSKVLTAVILFAMSVQAQAQEGSFKGPRLETLRSLSPEERAKYEANVETLTNPDFIKTHVKGPSYFFTPKGKNEISHLGQTMTPITRRYAKVFFVGRSLTALEYLLLGMQGADGQGPDFDEVPFSLQDKVTGARALSEKQEFLRRHLTTNGLDPKSISQRKTLLVDTLFSSSTAGSLLEFLISWATEEGLAEEVKANLDFLALYSPEQLARGLLQRQALEVVHERLGPYQAPSLMEVQAKALEMSLPGEARLKKLVGNVLILKISEEFMFYVGFHQATIQESFIPSHWGYSGALRASSFNGHSDDPAFLEMYHLAKLGFHLGGSGNSAEKGFCKEWLNF